MTTNSNLRELAELFSGLETGPLMLLLEDLLTPKEREAIAERWAIIKLLDEGHSQRDIRDRLSCSVATVTRGNRQLQSSRGGFKLALEKRARSRR